MIPEPGPDPDTAPPMPSQAPYDAILVVGFGGPEGPDEVMPFLLNVTRGRNIPRERLLQVAEHYMHFGGRSPINDQVRALIAALQPELEGHGIAAPIEWGNRNWHPMLAEAMRRLTDRGSRRVLAVVLAAYGSYSSCRQYREDIERAREQAGPSAPPVDKIRLFYNHSGFVEANAGRLLDAIQAFPPEIRGSLHVAFTAHSIPLSMARTSRYEEQLTETCRLVASRLGIEPDRWRLVFQSRSGRPQDPWLEPDILDHLDAQRRQGVRDLVIHPIGFLSDHVEILYDLDDEARRRCDELGLRMHRAASVGTHPAFVAMLRELIQERFDPTTPRRALGSDGPSHDACPADCCPAPPRPGPIGRPPG
jgi:ferrochelatase